MTAQTSAWDLVWRILLLGVGLGPSQSLFTIAIQNAAAPGQMGVATSSSQFFRQIGSTMGVALFGTVLTGELRVRLDKIVHGLDLDQLRSMSAQAQAQVHGARPLPGFVRDAVALAITHTFAMGLLMLGVAGAAVLLMPPIIVNPHAAERRLEETPAAA